MFVLLDEVADVLFDILSPRIYKNQKKKNNLSVIIVRKQSKNSTII